MVAVEEAQANRADIFDYTGKSAVAEDYKAFIDEEYLLPWKVKLQRRCKCYLPPCKPQAVYMELKTLYNRSEKEELRDKLILLGKGKDLSQADLDEILNVSHQAISRWEVGTSVPYNVSIDSLICANFIWHVQN